MKLLPDKIRNRLPRLYATGEEDRSASKSQTLYSLD